MYVPRLKNVFSSRLQVVRYFFLFGIPISLISFLLKKNKKSKTRNRLQDVLLFTAVTDVVQSAHHLYDAPLIKAKHWASHSPQLALDRKTATEVYNRMFSVG